MFIYFSIFYTTYWILNNKKILSTSIFRMYHLCIGFEIFLHKIQYAVIWQNESSVVVTFSTSLLLPGVPRHMSLPGRDRSRELPVVVTLPRVPKDSQEETCPWQLRIIGMFAVQTVVWDVWGNLKFTNIEMYQS